MPFLLPELAPAARGGMKSRLHVGGPVVVPDELVSRPTQEVMMDDDGENVAEKVAMAKAAADREAADKERAEAQVRAEADAKRAAAAQQQATAQTMKANWQDEQHRHAAMADASAQDPMPTVTSAGEVHSAVKGYTGSMPLPPPLVQPALQRDHETLVAHMKAWTRREISLAMHNGMGLEDRQIHNP